MHALLLTLALLATEPPPAPAVAITFADLVPVNVAQLADKTETAPVHQEKIAPLLGKRVKIDGFIFAPPKQHLSRFVIAPDNTNTRPKLEELIGVVLRPNQEVTYTLKSITVEATLSMTDAEQTKIGFYYHLLDAEASGPNVEVRHVQDEAGTKKQSHP